MKNIFNYWLVYLFLSAPIGAEPLDLGRLQLDYNAGFSASAAYMQNPGNLRREDSFYISDALLEIQSIDKNGTTNDLQFLAAIGLLQKQDLRSINTPLTPIELGLQYGWISYGNKNRFYTELGQLSTRMGIESGYSVRNSQVLLGELWAAQPDYYPGIRFNRVYKNLSGYLEFNQAESVGDGIGAVGLEYNNGTSGLGIHYFHGDKRSIAELVYKYKSGPFEQGILVDFHQIDAFPGQDNTALGAGIYLDYQIKSLNLPLRLEYLADGNSRIYGYDDGYTVTITPTLTIRENKKLRMEFIYANGNGFPFRDDNGAITHDQLVISLQAIIQF